MSGILYEVQNDGADVQNVVNNKLLPALAGMRMELAIASMCTMMLQQMCHNITEEQIQEGVKGMSGWLMTYVIGLYAPEGLAH